MRSENSAARVELVRHHQHRVAILVRQAAQPPQQFHLPPISRCCVGSSSSSSDGCCASARARITRCFSPPESWSIQRSRKCVRAHLRQRVAGHQAILFGFKAQPLAVRIASLQNVFPHAQRETATRFPAAPARFVARARAGRVADLEAIHFARVRKAASITPAINRSSVDLPLAFGPRMATSSRCCASKAHRPQREFRRGAVA